MTISHPIPFILNYLFRNHGSVTSDTLYAETARVRDMPFSVRDELSTLFTSVEDLEELSRAAELQYSPVQLTDIALHVLKKTGDYQQAIIEWYRLPVAGQTWASSKKTSAQRMF